MKHLIIGTAGHIDHGKTSLIKAITGRETDRLKEEQERGISIELGFTYFDLPSGQRAGIIDMPGHERFIKHMLAGVIGIDIILLVIAADEGIMPQTLEHLAILDLMGIKKGFIVLTKSDMVEDEWIDMVEEDIRDEIQGSFLEKAPMLRVSSTKKTGIEDLIELIDEYTKELEDKDKEDMPRLPVDRVFSISGFGTVVTGTLLSGKFEIGDEIQIFPGKEKARIRTLQVHDEDAELAYGGQRVAINLAGIKKNQVNRGDIIAPINSMRDTMMLDVKIKIIKEIDRLIENRTRLWLYVGTREVLCRIVILNKESLEAGEEAYAQLRLEEPLVAKRGDKFILRFYSPMFTIGGGEILESNPKKKKRFDQEAIKELEIKEKGSSTDIIENIIKDKSKEFPTSKDIAISTSMLEDNVKKEVNRLLKDGKIKSYQLTKDLYIIHKSYFKEIKERVLKELNKYHKIYPLRIGMPKEEMRSRIFKNANPRVAEQVIEDLIKSEIIEQKFESVFVKGFKIELNENQIKLKNEILNAFKEDLSKQAKKEDLLEIIKAEEKEIEEVLLYLIGIGEIIRLAGDIYISKKIYDEGVSELKEYIKEKGSITVGEFRDLIDGNRRFALAFLEYCDQVKVTRRLEDIRILY